MKLETLANHTTLRPVARQSVNNDVSGSARITLDVTLPIVTGVVADQIYKNALKSGKGTAAILSFIGGAAVHAALEGGVQVVKNKIDGLPWDNRLGIRALRGAQGGVFIAAGNLVGPYIQGVVCKRFASLHPIVLVGVSNAVSSVAGTTVRLAADPDTWKPGIAKGLSRIAVTSGIGAGTAMITGSGIKGAKLIPAVERVFRHLPYPFSG